MRDPLCFPRWGGEAIILKKKPPQSADKGFLITRCPRDNGSNVRERREPLAALARRYDQVIHGLELLQINLLCGGIYELKATVEFWWTAFFCLQFPCFR